MLYLEMLHPVHFTAGKALDAEEEGQDQDFKETGCRWEDCAQRFSLHEDLVKVESCGLWGRLSLG